MSTAELSLVLTRLMVTVGFATFSGTGLSARSRMHPRNSPAVLAQVPAIWRLSLMSAIEITVYPLPAGSRSLALNSSQPPVLFFNHTQGWVVYVDWYE